MAMELLLVREGTKLAAAEPISAESIGELRHGEMVTCTLRRTRNPRFHRLFFALLNAVFEAQDRYATFDQLIDAVKINTGYYDLVTLPGPVPVQLIKPKSISFARMDETAFRQFARKVMLFVISELLPGVGYDDLAERVYEIADGGRHESKLLTIEGTTSCQEV